MQGKYDMTARQRKNTNQSTIRDHRYITSHNLSDKKAIRKWMYYNNCKKGGKSRHYN